MPNPPPPTSPSLSPTKWTNPQELTLLRAVTSTKPAGMHKHFRMIAIQDALLSSGTIISPESERHASSNAGIWAKLNSLYDLTALDEREDAEIAPGEDLAESETESEGESEYWREFDLAHVDAEFEEMMWERRLAGPGDASSPVAAPDEEVGDGEDLRSSPAAEAEGSVRGRGARAAKRGRLAEVKAESSRPSTRRASKAASPAEDVEMVDAEAEHSDEDEEEDDEEGSETEDDKKAGTRSRARGVRRGRTRGRRRGK